ncbi:MAG: 4Fe-4S dicluster domain-containing protein [Candidatus Azobacteroides sp.]|nr:4Fe-4S dicluster domain-containing protein [Candidatus Azobacteroides sp.]
MNDLISQVQSLLENKTIDIFIGYEKGTRKPRPAFVSKAEEAGKLIFNENCSGNLAVYLTRKDLVEGKKVGIAASYYTLKNIILLFDENQLKEDHLRIITLSEKGEIQLLQSLEEIKQRLKEMSAPAKADEEEWVRKIDAMTVSERWAFWTEELSRCFKCYACRAACPMCYCTKCIVEINRPQWIQPWASVFSNMDWQINRVMHMAGRCSDCGACGAACPVGIPIHLLSHKMAEAVKENFGEPDEKGNVLSTFKPDDKENFIV